MGNICRSPTAEGVFRKLVEDEGLDHRIAIDSAGTHAYHVGEPPDKRAQQAARGRGIDLSGQRARRVVHADFQEFDHILVMDRENLDALRFVCPPTQHHKLKLFLDHAPKQKVREVPDPYYGGPQGFERVLDLVEQAARGLLNELKANLV
ncbi:low molecular weight phosphotyrosine protein phosphatase [Methylococcus sp. EFPC2]|nr:low molecular weight phosphotyrosine protein phosphatase [Methylococcus sp. EFPC2]